VDLNKENLMLAAWVTTTTFVVYHPIRPLLALAILAIMGLFFLVTAAAITFVILHYGRK
jgi:hypothetical protein